MKKNDTCIYYAKGKARVKRKITQFSRHINYLELNCSRQVFQAHKHTHA